MVSAPALATQLAEDSDNPGKNDDEDVDGLVGWAAETEEEHLRRHAGGQSSTCPRCRFPSQLCPAGQWHALLVVLTLL